MFVICINKLALKIMKNNEMTLLPNQYFQSDCFVFIGKSYAIMQIYLNKTVELYVFPFFYTLDLKEMHFTTYPTF